MTIFSGCGNRLVMLFCVQEAAELNRKNKTLETITIFYSKPDSAMYSFVISDK